MNARMVWDCKSFPLVILSSDKFKLYWKKCIPIIILKWILHSSGKLLIILSVAGKFNKYLSTMQTNHKNLRGKCPTVSLTFNTCMANFIHAISKVLVHQQVFLQSAGSSYLINTVFVNSWVKKNTLFHDGMMALLSLNSPSMSLKDCLVTSFIALQ